MINDKNALKSKYIIKKVNLTLAKEFWEKSSQAFTNPDIIKKFKNNVDCDSFKGEEKFVWSICCSKEKKFIYHYSLIILDPYVRRI